MSQKRYGQEILKAYDKAKDEVGRGLDGEYIARMEFDVKYMAPGFGEAYKKATGVKFGQKPNTRKNWEDLLKELNYDIIASRKSAKSGTNNIQDAFMGSVTQGMVTDSFRMKGAFIENGSVSSNMKIILQSHVEGNPQRDQIASRYRVFAWKRWEEKYGEARLGKQAIGQQTPYEHMDPSTAGGDALQSFKKELGHKTNQALDKEVKIITGYIGQRQKATIESIESLLHQALGNAAEWKEEMIFNAATGKVEMQRVVSGKLGSLPTNSKIAQKTDPDNIRKSLREILVKQFKNLKPLDPKHTRKFKGSKTMNEQMATAALLTVTSKFKKNKNTKVITSKKDKLKKSNKRGGRVAIKHKAHSVKSAQVKNSALATRGGGKRQNPAQRALQLKNLINAVLPQEILQQMGSPRLNNRTGRFRQSARVTDVRIGPRGGTDIDYTYQLNPYQTFEPGGAMGSTNRDPRSLIGLSIREVAKTLIGKKFIKVRRV